MEIFVPVVGVNFRGKEAKEIVKSLTLESEINLVPEPDNEYDQNAVRVYHDDIHIGYLARDNNLLISQALMRGETPKVKICAFENTLRPVLLVTLND